jgi:hypothetical protein
MMVPVSLYERAGIRGRAGDQHTARRGNGQTSKGVCPLQHVVSFLREMVRRPLMPDLGAMAYIPTHFRDEGMMG